MAYFANFSAASIRSSGSCSCIGMSRQAFIGMGGGGSKAWAAAAASIDPLVGSGSAHWRRVCRTLHAATSRIAR
jgi:hypothetical protein